ncbi:hypothetical protein DFP72DRAFT_1069619 [Ephemerocybe angulata]|uniref:Uncharacterized protein n=1 Tax=Ephemerocybe angulata TaxID=980116 RepID=A0A8H6HU41_9AGAR|nr:hypothetical protein DFP72DRAFT_1069619 [Tulosesus angulatus]
MDDFFNIPELRALVCDRLDRKSAYAFALTRRAFREEGLNRVWRSIDTFEPLFSYLPGDLLVETSVPVMSTRLPRAVMCLRRPLVREDLQKYLDYAKEIQEVKIDIYHCKRLPATDLMHALELAIGGEAGALSPNIKCFKAMPGVPFKTDLLKSLAPLTPLFVGNNLERLGVMLRAKLEIHTAIALSTFHFAPQLKALTFSEKSEGPLITQYMGSSSWENLQSFSAPTCPSISLLASLPQLRSLRLTNVQVSDIPIEAPSQGEGVHESQNLGFQSIQEMEIQAETFLILHEFIRRLPTSNMIRSLKLSTYNYASPEDIENIIANIRARGNPHTLVCLQVIDGVLDEATREGQMAVGEPDMMSEEPVDLWYHEDVDVLPTTFDFTNLEVLVLRFRERIRVTPEDLASIPETWPRLSRFEVTETGPRGQLPLIDHNDLLHFVERCPYLRVLGLPFDATRISGGERSSQGPFHLESLCVVGSPICSPYCVVEFILSNFPELKEMEIAFEDLANNYSDSMTVCRWARVRRDAVWRLR